MALPAALLSSSFDPRTIANLIHNRNGNTPLTLPATAQGSPPANAVPNASASASASDSLDLSGRGAGQSDGRMSVNGSGLYRLLQSSSLNLSARSLNVRLASGGSGGAAGRGALSVLNDAIADSGAAESGAMSRLRGALEKLGLSDQGVRDLLLVAGMLEKLDPEAFGRFVDNIENFAERASNGAAGASGASGASGAAPAAGGAAGAAASGGGSFQLHYVSISISVTEVTAAASSGAGGGDGQGDGGSAAGASAAVSARSFELRFERLEISFRSGGGQMQQGDPIVLDVDGDGTDLRPTSDGVLFDLTGSGRPVRTAFVQGDDALLFYDANLNGLLDDGRELVGNRVPGLDGMADLASMDADGDGRVTPLDPLWAGLRLFQDANGDGLVTPGEVKLLDALGIDALSALWERADQEDGEGLHRAGTSSFTRTDGTTGLMLDYYFGFRPAEPDA